MFALEYSREHTPEAGISSEVELTEILNGIAAAWKAAVERESTTYSRLNSYVTMWTVRNLMGRPGHCGID